MRNIKIRWLIRSRDMEDTLEIERCVFTDPWREADFIRALRRRDTVGMVAELDERVVGYFIYRLSTTQIEVTNFAVARDMWRQGIGRMMWQKLVSKLSPNRRYRLVVLVCERNLAGQAFFRAMGARCRRIVRDYYDCSDQDAYQFEYRVGSRVEAGR